VTKQVRQPLEWFAAFAIPAIVALLFGSTGLAVVFTVLALVALVLSISIRSLDRAPAPGKAAD